MEKYQIHYQDPHILTADYIANYILSTKDLDHPQLFLYFLH